MHEDSSVELPAEHAALLELGVALGQNHAFGLIAGRCSAAQAAGLHRLREEKLYKRCTEKWDDFCPRFLKISRSEADRTIKLWEEFGSAYFELSQLTRVSPETFRALAPAIQDGALHYQDKVIELNPENSRQVAAVVAELRSALPKRRLTRAENDVTARVARLKESGAALAAEFEKIGRDEALRPARALLYSALVHVRGELGRVAAQMRE